MGGSPTIRTLTTLNRRFRYSRYMDPGGTFRDSVFEFRPLGVLQGGYGTPLVLFKALCMGLERGVPEDPDPPN